MSTITVQSKSKYSNESIDELRARILRHAKDFKTAWVALGQAFFTVYDDKLYHVWGHESFDEYVEKELGLPKSFAIKLVKTYAFVEQEEPVYLTKNFCEETDPSLLPGFETLDVLRRARKTKELTKQDYIKIRRDVFEKGKDALEVRKDLTVLIKERKQLDPEKEREKRKETSLRKFLTAIKSFQKDMEALKLVPADIVKEAATLMKRIEQEVL